ncbi:ABC transporter ATP-binding protein [Aerococcus urinaeequi]|uniref:ABC transporter ATP-binding protein n=3 Tax=Aerococcus urinaeequi TaxID=51665 RepID=UPI003AAD06CE
MINCNKISKSFKGKQILKDVSLTIKNGKITSLIGANGAGKSTTIGVLVGYYHVDGGSIERESISIMPDADTIYQNMTGIQFLKMICGMKACPVSEAMELAEKLSIQHHLNKKIEGYSFGMKKKLAFIQCCVGNYDTYIFDEPTSGVDGPSAKIMLDLIANLREKNAGILLTSHNLDELERVSDFIYIIESGQITRSGSVHEILTEQNKGSIVTYILETSKVDILMEYLRNAKFKSEISNIKLRNQGVSLEIENDPSIIKEMIGTMLQDDIEILGFYQYRTNLQESVYGDATVS